MFREAKAVAVLSLAFGMAPVFASRITTIRVDAAPMRPVGWPYGQGRRAAQKPHPQRVLLDKSIASLPARYSKATSTEAARLWTNVAVQYVALAQRKESETILGGISFTDVLSALPPPPSWPAIANYVRQDKIVTSGTIEGRSLYIISLLLINDRKAQKVAIDKLQQQLTGHKDDPMYDGARRQLGALAAEYAEHREPSSRQAVEYILKTQLNTKRGQTGRVSLPDLVTLLGPEQAETVLRRVLRTRNTVAISRGAATYKLAQRLALAMIDELQVPQWSLTHRLDSGALYEAMGRRFPPKTPQEKRAAGTARTYYLMGLIANGRTEAAVNMSDRLAKAGAPPQLSDDAVQAMRQAGRGKPLFRYLHTILKRRPDLPYWSHYIKLGAESGESALVLRTVRGVAGKKNLPPQRRLQLNDYLSAALLASDEVEDGAKLLSASVAAKSNDADSYESAARAMQLARLGKMFGRQEWIDEGVRALTRDTGDGVTSSFMIVSNATTLVQLGQTDSALQMLESTLKRTVKLSYGEYYIPVILQAMASIYHETGRHDKLLNLLETSPWWGVSDLSEITSGMGGELTPLQLAVAIALHKAGRDAEASRIVQFLLRGGGGYDPAYGLLVELQGQSALPLLDKLFAADRFEERPLIWKAELLRQAGKLEEAEKTARAAIAIDPSDGEQPKGDRMRVYAVLAEIRAARGDAKEAAFFRGVVKAIRTAEDADDLYEVGLLERGIKQYKKALTYFSDAYCIQSRLAVQLASSGKYDEAAAHYRKAYELMPDSFGRMESHCFGCEGAFKGGQATSIAEQVFRRLVAQTPRKPQVHYLMGYLREEQGRLQEALPSFHRAVQLDPDYINAWQHLLDLDQGMNLPSSVRDDAAFALLRLDPSGKHARADTSRVVDLKRLWWVVAKMNPEPEAEESNTKLFPLPASAKKVEEKLAKLSPEERKYFDAPRPHYSYRMRPSETPAGAVAGTRRIGVISTTIEWPRMRAYQNRLPRRHYSH